MTINADKQLVKDANALLDLFSTPPSWIQEAFAGYRVKPGKKNRYSSETEEEIEGSVYVHSAINQKKADCFCLSGGIGKVTRTHQRKLMDDDRKHTRHYNLVMIVSQAIKEDKTQQGAKALPYGGSSLIVDWNDEKDRTFADVKRVVKRAAKLAAAKLRSVT